jgi:hypothetical protein
LGDLRAARCRRRPEPFHTDVENETRKGDALGTGTARSGPELGPLVASLVRMPPRFDHDGTGGRTRLFKAASGFGFRALRPARVTLAVVPGILAPPVAAYVADDGRALAWFGDGRPCIVHPTLADLCRMHGVEAQATLAA